MARSGHGRRRDRERQTKRVTTPRTEVRGGGQNAEKDEFEPFLRLEDGRWI